MPRSINVRTCQTSSQRLFWTLNNPVGCPTSNWHLRDVTITTEMNATETRRRYQLPVNTANIKKKKNLEKKTKHENCKKKQQRTEEEKEKRTTPQELPRSSRWGIVEWSSQGQPTPTGQARIRSPRRNVTCNAQVRCADWKALSNQDACSRLTSCDERGVTNGPCAT